MPQPANLLVNPPFSPAGAPAVTSTDGHSTLLVAAGPTEPDGFSVGPFSRVFAHTTSDVLRVLAEIQPHVVTIDWDVKEIDGPGVCASARCAGAAVLVVT